MREPDGTPIFEYEWNGKRRFQGKEFVQEDTLYSVATHHVGWMRADVELVKFAPETEKPEVLLALPKESEEGPLQVTLVATGLIATRWKRESVVGAKFYGLDGKEAFHPMAAALNAMHQHGVRLSEGDPQYPEFGGLFPSKTKDNWAVFSWPGLPGYDDDLLFVLSAIDSARAVPVKCEGHILRPVKSLRFVVVHPHLNLFLVGARLEDDMTMYLGHVRREGSMFKVATYRLRAFEYVWSPTFSRNGNVLLFATSEHDVEKVVFARLEDILSDINRRYPEAKLSLVSLESEVK
ncbi:MAG: hypothetical protein IPK50_05740 [Fibrobacterota bacterium]|nr:hypothetical protein [Fibrobacterota bacterium]QQS06397.1 MAG: hypothetical protein IPK50_05740 [Fibrobacterota bacterium]